MAWLGAILEGGGGEAAVGAAEGAGAGGAGAAAGSAAGVGAETVATGAGAGAAEGALGSNLGASQVASGLQADAIAPSFAPLTNTGIDSVNKVSSTTLNNFKAGPSFLDNLGDFGKNFGLEIAKNIVQGTLRDIPGGRTIGLTLQKSFDSPAIKNLFTDPNDELTKRDDIIKLLLKQRLGKA